MSTRPISAWIVPLVGHQFDLEDLPLFLEGSVAQVAKREDAYYLVLPTALAGSAPEPIRALAAEHLALINGASSLLSESFRPIALGEALYGIDSEGHVANTVIQIGSAELRMKGGHVTSSVNGIARPDARVGAALPIMRAAAASTAAADILVIVGRLNPTWSELYLVYELIKSNCGGRMFDLGWIQKSDATLFCRTANSYTALGRKARHGKDRGQPPQSPMPQHEAKTLMRALAAGWLRHVSSTAP
jgi:hypothetical protein